MSNLSGPVVVYERTSGDEGDGQDVRAQLAQTIHRATMAGAVVLASAFEEDVPGDTPWTVRAGLQKALRESAERGGIPILVREVSRLWRGDPSKGLLKLANLRALVVLDAPIFEREDGAWVDDTEEAELMRFIGLWTSWAEKRRSARRSALAMQEIVAGRRPTRSGKPHHRPPIEYDPAHLEAAREVYARTGNLSEAHREMLRLRGFFEAKDPRTQKARTISRAKVGELLGVYSVRKPGVSESGEAPAEPDSISREPLPDAPADGSQNIASAGTLARAMVGRDAARATIARHDTLLDGEGA